MSLFVIVSYAYSNTHKDRRRDVQSLNQQII